MPEIEFATIIISFTAYYFIERCLRLILAAYSSSFYEKLRASRKDMVFFGIWMGLLISLFSTPFCVHGAWDAWISWRSSQANEQPDGWLLDYNAKICVSARAVLWVSELNRLDFYGLYVIHHAGSIIALVSFLFFEWPIVIFLIIFSTLVSEIPGDLLWMVSSYIETIDSNDSLTLTWFKYCLVRFNASQYAFIRGGGILAVLWLLWTNAPELQDRPILEQIYGYTLIGLYALFCASYIRRQYNSIRSDRGSPFNKSQAQTMEIPPRPRKVTEALEQEWSRSSIHLRIGTNPSIIIVPYGLFMGLGFFALVYISLTFGTPSHQIPELLSSALNLTLISAVFFARLMSIVMEDGISTFISHPIRTFLRPGFWLHGGLFGATVGALCAYRLGYIEHLTIFAGSLAIGLPLYETFARVGCYTYGCCYGHIAESLKDNSPTDHVMRSTVLWSLFPYPPVRYSHPTHYAVTRINPNLLHKPLIPIQLISATLFLLLFLGISLPLAHSTSVDIAGAATLVCHAVARLITETYRADYRGREGWWLSVTGKMALLQAAGAMTWLVKIILAEEGIPVAPGQLERASVSDIGRLRSSLFAAVLGVVVYGVHVGEIGSWVGVKDNRSRGRDDKK